MIRFNCDYAEGAHPRIIKKLSETNLMQTSTYGEDEFCYRAADLIKKELQRDDCDIHFLVGGTQTNLTVISSSIRPYEGVIAASTGHIGVHETGAIEATGHKVLTIPSSDGKITASQIDDMFNDHVLDPNHEHMVRPGMVYISQPTENGTIYRKSELEQISMVCSKHGLLLYIDGARMGYALASPASDFTLCDIARLSDVFYIGGTKQGALLGEAVVITNNRLKENFRYCIKQRGAMLAKGRLLGIQFETLFEDGLYFRLSESAVSKAVRIREAFESVGITLLYDSWTNQQFPVLNKKQMEKLSEKYMFEVWAKVADDRFAIRICTSWATTEDAATSLINDIKLF